MLIRLFLLFILSMTGAVIASDIPHSASHHKNHGAMEDNAQTPTEPGQGAFAALAEIVALLEKDPNTDWSKVDINGLREHLVDMNELTLNADVTQRVTKEKVVFTVKGTGRTLKAIQAMVPAHSAELARTTNWQTETKTINSGVVFTLSSDQPTELQKIAALSFFGVMAVGNHHQPHHWQMATGQGHFH